MTTQVDNEPVLVLDGKKYIIDDLSDTAKYLLSCIDDVQKQLLAIGMKKIFHSTENPLPWIDMQVNAVEHTNFFENRATEYAKASTQGNWQDIFK